MPDASAATPSSMAACSSSWASSSASADILPEGVTKELRGLQDEVPAETLADVQAVIAAEFKRPVGEVFAWFKPEPEAAASLAQA